ncbi:cytochrome c [Komagataeibacter intermedius]|uniref:Cytochrome C biogenesis protein DsbD n=2 Tax=Komagataeibacter intermedius TaxID=66229 RepID=A0A0N1FAU6_9PROT|nr:cytochrome c [Komagataeibacter intermedius]KPH86370.1 cytochrome C biogenesis protein DsbD [Komagataeibacter intermedius AF2]MCF3637223.1 cytochrome c [Komagataeibacter intermedius]GAN87210.1 cytochrome c-552 class I [Komagataeibacter intermedius TF2]
MKKRLLAAMLCLSIPAEAAVAADGTALFQSNCSMCHQPNGQGVPGQFPALAGRVGKIASTPEGRQYVVAVALNGIMGAITIQGNSYAGFMPPFKMLADDQVVAILNHVAGLPDGPDATIFTVQDVTAARAKSIAPSAMVEKRKALDALHPLP